MLNYLGALDDEGELTDLGSKMAQIPLEPELAKILLSSEKYKSVNDILTIVSLLSVPNLFLRPKDDVDRADQAKSRYGSIFRIFNIKSNI